ncbi:unnamed protein product [Heligmosomoides polygyrus]|uniref:PHD domain-containing protein n=1 Tax=Heligmosomoides polygyrus TaxID=6339 RepID=A0A183FY70_HELPZ|nr:unnamed protein product [Heligmosomoides polygyrus]
MLFLITNEIYCICDWVSYDPMTPCHARGCKVEWYHIRCMGLKEIPEGTLNITDLEWSDGCEDFRNKIEHSYTKPHAKNTAKGFDSTFSLHFCVLRKDMLRLY